MAGEGNGWGQQPTKGDTRLATGLSMVSLSQGTPPALPGLNGERCSRTAPAQDRAQDRARSSAQRCDALLWPGQTDGHFQGSLGLLLQGRYFISLLEMDLKPGRTQASNTGDTFDGRGKGRGVPGTEQVLIH